VSIEAINRVWKTSKQRGSALLLLLAIADYAKDDGSNAWPSLQTLANKTRMSKRNVIKLVQKIEANGELRVRREQGPNGVNFYDIISPLVNASSPPKKQASERQFTPPVNASSPQLVNASSPNPSSLTVIEPSITVGISDEMPVKPIQTEQKPKTVIRDKFLELTRLKMPYLKPQAGFWWSQFAEIMHIADGDILRATSAMEKVIKYMQDKNLSIVGPQSIIGLVRSVCAGQQLGGQNGQQDNDNRGPRFKSPQQEQRARELQAQEQRELERTRSGT
jgi:hypothetical protein